MSKDKLKNAASSIASGVNLLLIASHNGPIRTRMNEIEEEIAKLQKEHAELEEQLLER